MSKLIDNALEAVQNSQFYFKDNHTLEVQNAVIIWTNFRGEANRFGNTARTFNLVLTEPVAEELDSQKWRVRSVDSGNVDENGNPILIKFVNIKVNIDSAYPPTVTLYTEYNGKKSRKTLDKDTIGELDRADIKMVDCVVNAYVSKKFPDHVTGYLKKMNVVQEPDVVFGGKYDDWDSEIDSQLQPVPSIAVVKTAQVEENKKQ